MNAYRMTVMTAWAAALIAIFGCSTRENAAYGQVGYGSGAYADAPAYPQLNDLAGPYMPDPSAWPGDDQPGLDAQGVTPLTQGPVHEAFAAPITAGQENGLVVPVQPPQPIAEVPPSERPQGNNVVWIPGYWSWVSDEGGQGSGSQGFIWVSGLWRDVPPNMRWEPGYWTAVEGGFRWVPGFWASAAVTQFQYLPAPPDLLDDQPTQPQPSADAVWNPGYWDYRLDRYAWRPGSWMNGQADWVWTPAHYIWTPRGDIFVQGYWDYPIQRRGMLFAPACFTQPVYQQPQFVYSPTVVIDIDAMVTNLFVRPRNNHYYFGDYYDPNCLNAGIYPLTDYSRQPGRFDPIYARERWEHRRDDPRWDEHQKSYYEQRRDNKSIRPPRTFAAQELQRKQSPRPAQTNVVLARPIRDIATSKTLPFRVEKLTPAAREKSFTQSRDLAKAQTQRVRQEVNPVRPNVALTGTALAPTKILKAPTATGKNPAPVKAGNPGTLTSTPLVTRTPTNSGARNVAGPRTFSNPFTPAPVTSPKAAAPTPARIINSTPKPVEPVVRSTAPAAAGTIAGVPKTSSNFNRTASSPIPRTASSPIPSNSVTPPKTRPGATGNPAADLRGAAAVARSGATQGLAPVSPPASRRTSGSAPATSTLKTAAPTIQPAPRPTGLPGASSVKPNGASSPRSTQAAVSPAKPQASSRASEAPKVTPTPAARTSPPVSVKAGSRNVTVSPDADPRKAVKDDQSTNPKARR